MLREKKTFLIRPPVLVTLGRDYRRFNRYLESLVKFTVWGIYSTRTRINTSKFGKNPCTNKEIMSNLNYQLGFSPTRTRTTTFSDHLRVKRHLGVKLQLA